MADLVYEAPRVVAEIGCNHKGDFEIAKELILLAKEAGATVAKFQKRNPVESTTEDQYRARHPVAYNSYGETYGAHREFLEFTQSQHAELKSYAESINIGWSTSVWDVTSARQMIELAPDFLKVPSACNNHLGILQILRDEYVGDVHISIGMTTKLEEEELIAFFKEKDQLDRLVLYACTAGYPVSFDDVCLLELNRLKDRYDGKVKSIGFSGHHLGIAIDVAAYTLGASWIERHFTKDRTWKGTDHAASLEPPGLQKLVRNLDATYRSLTYKSTDILQIERAQRDKLKYRSS